MGLIAAKIDPTAKEELVGGLTQALSETAVETTKAQNFHWNVEGASFGPLHALFQEIYEDHFEAQDTLAERIKALDAHAEGRYSAFLERSAVTEHDGHASAGQMVRMLLEDQETLSSTLSALAQVAEKCGDWATNDMATGRVETHDKFAWMLRAHLRGADPLS
ncbi:Dps family protein [Mangrovibrevibacter kandeliae]|uniref:Dps family protein n=1 Tax=Mangrovibrevibacter kandeliae TaxID=2968473 RepID=UPI0021188363|nr:MULTISPECIES: DNA starvation/stationary phase protection protein [unclassified Aurantimonas]MCQ8781295.1 DNA starvation/stationary phase protection protein [Aurantimonas sp. CSK15Z-1]MCW4114077.1 DNA starvation/stationary phase protection protein [Aurantimonas sp. MSK8Z-1]